MKILLTSFGIDQTFSAVTEDGAEHDDQAVAIREPRQQQYQRGLNVFQLMPPVSRHIVNRIFVPDYPALL